VYDLQGLHRSLAAAGLKPPFGPGCAASCGGLEFAQLPRLRRAFFLG